MIKIKNKIKLVAFDLDGTLVNAYPAIVKSFNFTMRKMGRPGQSDLTIRRAVGWGDTNLIRPFVSRDDLDEAMATYRNHHKTSLTKYTR